jgi:hypothetical protein
MLCLAVRSAEAHFVWVATQDAPKGSKACLWFAESAEPGEAHLIEKVKGSKLVLRQLDDSRSPLELAVVRADETGALEAELKRTDAFALEAACDYGVITRGEQTFRLHYYAKHLSVRNEDDCTRLGRTESHALDIVPYRSAKGWAVRVLFQGQPAAKAELVVHTPSGKELTPQLDAAAECQLPDAEAGLYAFRAGMRQEAGAAKEGAADTPARHYATLTIRLPSPKPAAAAEATSATELLRQARLGRAVWKKFKGFSAQAVVRVNGESEETTLEIDADGIATTTLKNERLKEWTEEQLQSLVQHRLPAGDIAEEATFAEEANGHPLGRLIRLGDKKFQSAYRIKDGVVTEVNRQAGDTRFTISVLDVTRNEEQKYLPHIVSLSTWDQKTGALLSSQMVTNTWARHEGLDLPRRIFEVYTTSSGREVREMELSNFKLPTPANGAAR